MEAGCFISTSCDRLTIYQSITETTGGTTVNSRQWGMLKSRLVNEVGTILEPLVACDWNAETNRRANRLLSARAEQLRAELNLPIPEGTKVFAKIVFNTKVSPPKMLITASYQVPWSAGGRARKGKR